MLISRNRGIKKCEEETAKGNTPLSAVMFGITGKNLSKSSN